MEFLALLLEWYELNKRNLPWRKTTDPYKIWVSEIILQQTRVEQGRDYYSAFIRQFRTIKSFAGATEEEILRLWQGLGYYSRARNMHAAALEVLLRYDGKFPCSYEEILALKGIGPYTAAAIASISFGLPYPVVDGNVLRFFARYFGVKDPVDSAKGKNHVREIASGFITRTDPGTFNQAVMEFGALQCRPGLPDCPNCPLKAGCHAFTHDRVDSLPVKSKNPVQRPRYFNYLVIIRERKGKSRSVFLRKRTGKDIWQHLYDFPLVESARVLTGEELRQTQSWKEWFGGKSDKSKFHGFSERKGPVKYILSHQVIFATFNLIKNPPVRKFPWMEVPMDEIDHYPLPRLISGYLKDLQGSGV